MSQKSLYKGELYIDAATLAIVRLEISLSVKGLEEATIFGISKAMTTTFGLQEIKILGYTMTINYQQHGQKWYLSSISNTTSIDLIKSKRDFKKHIFARNDLVITGVEGENIQPFTNEEIASYHALDHQHFGQYDASFWENYNVIHPDPIFEKAFEAIRLKNKK